MLKIQTTQKTTVQQGHQEETNLAGHMKSRRQDVTRLENTFQKGEKGKKRQKTTARIYSTNHFQLKIYLHLLSHEIPKM